MPGLKPKELLELLKATYNDWNEDKAPRLGAALAYYTTFSLTPLLLVLMGIVGLFFSGSDELVQKQLTGLIGDDGAKAISDMLENANKNQSGGILATITGFAMLLMGAGGVFGQLQDALNTIWEVQPKPGGGFMGMLKARFLSFSMVLGTGFLLLVSLFISAVLSSLGQYMNEVLPVPEFVLQAVNLVVGFFIITLLFAMIYKVLPDVQIKWRDVWIGAAMTSLLFSVGKLALGLYLGKSSVASAYGAAGSLAALMLWIYYAAQILFFGAEFTQVYAKKYGSQIVPAPGAEPVTAEARAQQGLPPGNKQSPVPAGAAVAVVHPQGLDAPPKKARDWDFLWPAAVGFLGMLLFKQRRPRSP